MGLTGIMPILVRNARKMYTVVRVRLLEERNNESNRYYLWNIQLHLLELGALKPNIQI